MACSMDITITNLVLVGVLVILSKNLINLVRKWRLEKMLEKFEHTPKDKVVLHTTRRGKTVPSPSPFALKLETYLRIAKIPYEIETKHPYGPKGKVPWITYNGVHIPDSHLAIQFLNKKFSVNLNSNATEEHLAIARAVRVMVEERLFWGGAYYRIVENLSSLSQVTKVPTTIKFLFPLIQHRFRKRLDSMGIGKHTPTEIYEMTNADLHTTSKLLGNKAFFGGDEPCEEDCAIFGMVAQALWGLPGSSFERLAHGELNNLKGYCERMKEHSWTDWEECLNT